MHDGAAAVHQPGVARRMWWLQRASVAAVAVDVVIHLLAWFGLVPALVIGLLFPAIFVMFGAMVLVSTSENRRAGERSNVLNLGGPVRSALAGVFMVVAFASFFLSGPRGSAELVNGVCTVSSHGKVVEVIPAGECGKEAGREIRLFTGLGLVFLGWPAIYFTKCSPDEWLVLLRPPPPSSS